MKSNSYPGLHSVAARAASHLHCQGVTQALRRYYGGQHLHFITASCYRRRPLLGNVRRRDLFLRILEEVRRRYRFVVLGVPRHRSGSLAGV